MTKGDKARISFELVEEDPRHLKYGIFAMIEGKNNH